MHLVIPPEMLNSAAQLVIYVVTVVAALTCFMTTARA
jgi:hypothetical protein